MYNFDDLYRAIAGMTWTKKLTAHAWLCTLAWKSPRVMAAKKAESMNAAVSPYQPSYAEEAAAAARRRAATHDSTARLTSYPRTVQKTVAASSPPSESLHHNGLPTGTRPPPPPKKPTGLRKSPACLSARAAARHTSSDSPGQTPTKAAAVTETNRASTPSSVARSWPSSAESPTRHVLPKPLLMSPSKHKANRELLPVHDRGGYILLWSMENVVMVGLHGTPVAEVGLKH